MSAEAPEEGFKRVERSAEHGFTLIETLVALAVFAIAALALLRLEGATVATAARLQERQIGQLVARGVGYAALTDPQPPVPGSEAGEAENGGRSWRWTRTVSRMAGGSALRIDVAVTDADGRSAGALALVRGAGR
ncbi:type II secretion system minor pseudopilin GspI [Sphingomonas jatrophae]|uniref:Type II secretion system protein I n=1 Tax=Sphingomonas jatrophae TaxID=1166337 RepID=A0A1I6JD00_9SPHN|nr:type II secretion system minor pseudopilin GspI [Sphingomonas jatrophae]SFR76893.1 general secretion pathway protein I [Sphingomonas jatrophae]